MTKKRHLLYAGLFCVNENIVYIMLAFVLLAFAMLTVTFAYLYSQTNYVLF